MQKVDEILKQAQQAIQICISRQQLEEARLRYLGKKGELSVLLKSVGQLSDSERPQWGQAVNAAKQEIQAALEQRDQFLKQQELDQSIASQSVDITLPGRNSSTGSLHPVLQVRDRLVNILSSMGFVMEEGPEIEDAYHNFDALNIPVDHPARSQSDTFYLTSGEALRVQTSCVQVRCMEKQKPPLRMIAPGKTYRWDFDSTHTPMFHQIEGLLVDQYVTLANLKSVLLELFQRFFDSESLKLRLRPSYFPFTEPSAEVDIWFEKRNRWLEMGGCGMVHPNVLRFSNIDPDVYSAYAFGFGFDRLAMLYYGVTDIRSFFENDIRFLKQF